MMIYTNKSLPTPDIIRNLGIRFRDYRMRMGMTRKDVSVKSAVGMTTLYRFESGDMTDISFGTLMRLLRVIDQYDAWEELIPELPESPYLYDDKNRKRQRVRHPNSHPKP